MRNARFPAISILFAAALQSCAVYDMIVRPGEKAAAAAPETAAAPELQVVPVEPKTKAEEEFLVKEDITKVKLDNGLTVIVKENPAAAVVALQAWVRAGSADEDDAIAGIAHVHEHMLFKGTKKRAVGEIAKEVEASGGEINAWTSFDETVYHIVMASRQFDKGIDILADAVTASTFDPTELAREKEVVLEEIRQNHDIPSRKVMDELFKSSYRKHPYRRPIIGSEETVKSLTRDKILAFYKKWYVPENIFVIIVGDVDAKKAVAAVRKAFSGFAGKAPEHKRAKEPPQKETAAAVLRDKVVEVQFAAGWHIPGLEHPDTPVLDLLAVIIGQGESSWLRREVRREKGLVNDVSTFSYTPTDPGLFVLGAGVPASKLKPALDEIYKVFFRAAHRKVTEADLEKAKALLLSDVVYQKETVQGFARKIGYYELVTGDLSFEEKYLRAIAAVTPDDVLRVAAKYFKVENMTAAAILPDEKSDPMLEKFAKDDLIAPARAAIASLSAPAAPAAGGTFKKKLASGITLLVRENHAVPLTAARAVFMGGSLYEGAQTAGISNFMARMLTRGTGKHTADEIAREMDMMAGGVSGFSGRNSVGVRGEFLSKYFERGMGIFLDCLSDSRFPEAEIEKERPIVIEEIRNREDDLSALAFDLFAQTLYKVHPYRWDPLGTEKNVVSFKRDQLVEYYKKYMVPANMTLVVTGDVDPVQVAAFVEERLAGWKPGDYAPPKVPAEEPIKTPRTAYKYKEKEQAHIVLGFMGTTVRDPDRHALEVLSTVLAGQGGRLFLELRDKKSLAYAITSFAIEGVDPGYFAVYMACAPDKVEVAVESIREELKKTAAEAVDPKDLDRARNYLIGTQEISLQRNAAKAAQMAFNEAYGLGWEETFRYAEKIGAVDAKSVQEVAKKYLDQGRYVLAIIRPQGKK